MPTRESKIAEFAKVRNRDSQGHFIPIDKTSNPLSQVKQYQASPTKSDPNSSDDDLVDVRIHNPLSRIAKLLQDIKTHQSTTFAVRFTIPLIALPIFILAAFQLGRANTACSAQIAAKIGTVQVVEAFIPKDSPGILGTIFSFLPSIPKLTPQKELVLEKRAVLLDSQNETWNIIAPPEINFEDYRNYRLVLTGKVAACTNTITIDSPRNITAAAQ